MIFDLKLFPFIFDFVDEDFKFDSGAVLGFDEGVDYFVELSGAFVEVNEEVPELPEDKLFALPVFEEEESDKVFIGELYEFFGSHDFFFTEIVFDHETMHGGVEFDFVVIRAFEFVFVFEDFNDLFGEVTVVVVFEVVLIGMFTDFEVEFDAFDVVEFFFVLSHGAGDESVFVEFLFDPIL